MAYVVYFSVFAIVIICGCMFSILLRVKLQSQMKKINLEAASDKSVKFQENSSSVENSFNYVQYGGILSVILNLADLVTDVLVTTSLLKNADSYILGVFALTFIAAPVIFNIVVVMVFSHHLTEKPACRIWIEKNEFLFTFIQSFSIFSVETLSFSSCGIWNLNLPLQKCDIYKLRTYSMANNILEDIPQLVIVIIANSGGSKWSPFSIISILSSLSSLIWTVLFRFQACSLLYRTIAEEDEDVSVTAENKFCTDMQKL